MPKARQTIAHGVSRGLANGPQNCFSVPVGALARAIEGFFSVAPAGAYTDRKKRLGASRLPTAYAVGYYLAPLSGLPESAVTPGHFRIPFPIPGRWPFPPAESRFPAVGRRLPFWQFPRPSACPPLAGPSSLGLPACGLCVRSPALPWSSFSRCILCFALVTPAPALVYKNGCPQVSGCPFPAPGSPLLGVIHNGVWPCVHVKTIKFGSKSVKKATFSVKKASKRRAFRHAHLNIWGGTPSGASARAVFAFRNGKKARWGRAKWRPEKLSTICAKLGTRNPERLRRTAKDERQSARHDHAFATARKHGTADRRFRRTPSRQPRRRSGPPRGPSGAVPLPAGRSRLRCGR